MYKSAFILGKFLPVTKGHQYLIDTAILHCEKVTVLVCSLQSEPIPGDLRFKWVKELYVNNPKVNVVHCAEELPQYPEQDPDNFWDIWVDVTKRYCPADIDVIFTSELYGNTYAEKLGIKHHMVDLERYTFSVSATKVRESPFAMWAYIPDVVKPYYVKRIAIMGPESAGKSELTKKLAKKFNTNYVEEYGRTLYENNGGSVSQCDFIKISNGRQLIEDAMIKQSNKLLFCDTEDITTSLFYEMYYPNGDDRINYWLNKEIGRKPKYDLYLLLKPDCDAVQDGTRNFLDKRYTHYERIRTELIARHCNFVEISGSWNDRYNESLNEIYYMLK